MLSLAVGLTPQLTSFKFHTITMDNASNCDVLADELAVLIPSCRGKDSHTQCFPHTVNLVAKVYNVVLAMEPK